MGESVQPQLKPWEKELSPSANMGEKALPQLKTWEKEHRHSCILQHLFLINVTCPIHVKCPTECSIIVLSVVIHYVSVCESKLITGLVHVVTDFVGQLIRLQRCGGGVLVNL